ncbi:hypothetical protein DN468_32245, partial [Burkholderia multivorans]
MVTNDMHPGDDDNRRQASDLGDGPRDGPGDGAGNTEEPRSEIAIVRYRECQLAAVYGLTDVFRVANEQLALL